MKHLKADLSKIEIVKCLYHRAYNTHPHATLNVSIDGVYKDYKIRKSAIYKDRFYHKKGLPAILVVYNDSVIAYEIIKDDIPNAEINFHNLIKRLTSTNNINDWYFDGSKFYKLDARPNDEFLSIGNCSVLDPIHFTYGSSIDIIYNDVFIISKDGQVLIQSTPIIGSMKSKNLECDFTNTEENNSYINLACLLNTCSTITSLYDPCEIERFDITQYMILHKTVNLAKLPPYVKNNSPSYVKPNDMISYLMGLLYKENDFNNCKKLMWCIKTIVRNGVVNVKSIEAENVYTGNPIELVEVNFSKYI